MSNKRLGCLEMTKQSIDLTTIDVLPINPLLYLAGPNAREFKKVEVDKMPYMDDIEPPQSENASTILSAPEKNG